VRTGVSSIVASWFISPICSAIVVFILFGLIRTFVLRSEHSFTRAFYVNTALRPSSCALLHFATSPCSLRTRLNFHGLLLRWETF
jgi:phosphate/sulfate permease